MVGVTEKHNFEVEVQIYDVPVCNARVLEVEGTFIDHDTLLKLLLARWSVNLLLSKV